MLRVVGVGLVLAGLVVLGSGCARQQPGRAPARTPKSEPRVRQALTPPAEQPRTRHAIKVPAHPFTERDYQQVRAALHRRMLIAGYLQHGRRDPRWDKQALSYLEAWVKIYSGLPGAPSADRLLSEGAALSRTCTDPLVLYLCARALLLAGRKADAGPLFQRALAGLECSRYPKYWTFAAAVRFMETGPKSGLSLAQAHALAQRVIALAPQMAAEDTFRGREQRVLWELLNWSCEEGGVLSGGWAWRLVGELDNHPGKLAVADLLRGMLEEEVAWDARGYGSSAEVSPEGWKQFEQQIAIAAKRYRQAWQRDPSLPEAPTRMIAMSAHLEADEQSAMWLWFQRAVDAQFDYAPAYSTMLHYLKPRWVGSYEEMHDFGLACLETGRFDTRVPGYYLSALCAIERDRELLEHPNPGEYWKRPGIYERLLAMCDSYQRAQPQGRLQWDTLRAAVAMKCGYHDQAAVIVKRLGSRGSDYITNRVYRMPYAQFRAAVEAATKGKSSPRGHSER